MNNYNKFFGPLGFIFEFMISKMAIYINLNNFRTNWLIELNLKFC